jgi:hypothetical protein
MQSDEALLDIGAGAHFLGAADQHAHRALPHFLEQGLFLGVGIGVADGGVNNGAGGWKGSVSIKCKPNPFADREKEGAVFLLAGLRVICDGRVAQRAGTYCARDPARRSVPTHIEAERQKLERRAISGNFFGIRRIFFPDRDGFGLSGAKRGGDNGGSGWRVEGEKQRESGP